eukprot:9474924-Alexandrium_andersonii.AAC.1
MAGHQSGADPLDRRPPLHHRPGLLQHHWRRQARLVFTGGRLVSRNSFRRTRMQPELSGVLLGKPGGKLGSPTHSA